MENKSITLLTLGLMIGIGQQLSAKETKAAVKIDEQVYMLVPCDREEANIEHNETTSKAKISFYLDQEMMDKLDELHFQRRRERKKTSKSAIICEAIDMLYEKEIRSQGIEI